MDHHPTKSNTKIRPNLPPNEIHHRVDKHEPPTNVPNRLKFLAAHQRPALISKLKYRVNKSNSVAPNQLDQFDIAKNI